MDREPKIFLALVDDWELRGSGAGNIEKIQFASMRELVRIFNKYGIRGSFNAELMQQLTFRKFQADHPELKRNADDWDSIVKETYRQGHDIQLHIHPQWKNAEYNDGTWNLKSDWSILNHDPGDAFEMLNQGKRYLENLLRPVNPGYRCVSFRSGAWCIAPSDFALGLLVELGIKLDISLVDGIHWDTKNIALDYRNCEEPFFPFYPNMKDARKMSQSSEAIICIPTNHFNYPVPFVLIDAAKKLFRKTAERFANLSHKTVPSVPASNMQKYHEAEWADRPSFKLQNVKNLLRNGLKGIHCISDIANISYPKMSYMLKSIREKIKKSGYANAPVILENHTKDIKDFGDIERFISDIAAADDIQCVTLTELAEKAANGKFPILRASASGH